MKHLCGITWGWVGERGTWADGKAASSMERMAALAGNWTAIAFCALQETPQSTHIKFREAPTVTDREILWAIEKARELKLKICLKPVVNVENGSWRAHINFFDHDVPGEPTWSEWFESYNEFILHYASIAQETKCEMFCIGCEMVQADKRVHEWRELISQVREIYTGTITYNCDKYQEEHILWWDAVDVISSSGYYPIDQWDAELDRIEAVVRRTGKAFFFMEAGCPSRDHAGSRPHDCSLPGGPNEKEQAAYYQEMFKKCEKREWMSGYMLWNWPARLYDIHEAKSNRDYCMYGKEAEEIVRNYYKKRIMEV